MKDTAQLPDQFYRTPETARTTMPLKALRALLLATDARVMSCGYMWDVVGTHIGAGVYEVKLRRKAT